MRHTLVLKEAPKPAPNGSIFLRNVPKDVTVMFEYAVAQPVDDLARAVVRSFFNEDVQELKTALQTFTTAGYNPSRIEVVGDFEEDAYKSFRPDNLRSLLAVALLTKKPRLALMKTLVNGGCDPFAPFNFVAAAILDENGPSSMGRRKWSWLLENTAPERWMAATTSPDHHRPHDPEISLVHLAIRMGKVPVVAALVQRLGLAMLDASGPPLFEWLDTYHPPAGSPASQATRQALLDALKVPLIAMEQAALRETMGETVVTKAGARPRL